MQRPSGRAGRDRRLRSPTEIRRVYARGSRASAASVSAVALVDGDGLPRVAVVAGRSIGGAVVRNRAKRRLREAVRRELPRMLPGARVILIATALTARVEFQELADAVADVVRRARASVPEPAGV